MTCAAMASCPDVIEVDGRFFFIGNPVTDADYLVLAGRIGPGEAAVEVPPEVVKKWLEERHEQAPA